MTTATTTKDTGSRPAGPNPTGVGGLVRSIARRSAVGPSTGRKPTLVGPGIVLVVLALIPLMTNSGFELSRLELILTYMMVAIGLNFGFGLAGQLSIAQPVIMGVAAYTAGLLNVNQGWNAWATLVPALVAAVIIGMLLNAPGFRLRGWYLAITTFFAVLVFPSLVTAAQRWTHGSTGLGPITSWPGIIGTTPQVQFEFVLGLTAVCWLAVWAIAYSKWGVLLRSMRDSPNAAGASGVNMPMLSLAVSALASLPVGLAGWVFAHSAELISPNSFGFNLLLLLMASVMLGGRGTLWGPVIGTAVFETLSLYIGAFSVYNSIILGFGVFVCATAFPTGIVPPVREFFRVRLAKVQIAGEPSLAGPELDSSVAAAVSTTPPLHAPEAPAAASHAAHAQAEPVLKLTGIHKAFGGNLVLDDVNVDLYPGKVHGLVGPNGSGKTTLLNVITGFVSRDGGTVLLRGQPVPNLRPYQIARRGIRRSFQVPQVIGELSVAENMRLGALGAPPQAGEESVATSRKAEVPRRVVKAAEELGLSAEYLDMPVKELPLGLRRIVEIGRAMVAEPAVICLDEPAAGLPEEDLVVLQQTLHRVAAGGCAVLLIEHNLSFVREVADVMIELQDGNVAEITELRSLHDDRRAKAGGQAGAGTPTAAAGTGRPEATR